MVVADTCLIVQILPVGIGIVILVQGVLVLASILTELAECGTVHHRILLEDTPEAHITIIGHFGGSALSTLDGGDDDYTVGTTGTVDSGSRGILQDIHRLDVGGVDVRKGTHEGDTIEHDQRVVRSSQRALTTDTDLHLGTRLRRSLCHKHTGDTTLQGLGGVGGCHLIQLLTTDVGHRTRHGLTTLGTVTDDHHFVHHVTVFFKIYTHTVGGLHFL